MYSWSEGRCKEKLCSFESRETFLWGHEPFLFKSADKADLLDHSEVFLILQEKLHVSHPLSHYTVLLRNYRIEFSQKDDLSREEQSSGHPGYQIALRSIYF